MILSELILSKISEKSNRGQNFSVFFQVPAFCSLVGNKRFFKLQLQEHRTDVIFVHPL